jgi:hypothetical protein
MVAVPCDTPVTDPDNVPTVAIAVLLLLHVPPLGVLERLVLALSQTTNVPVIAVGTTFTVTG